jgi:hypothetical protein
MEMALSTGCSELPKPLAHSFVYNHRVVFQLVAVRVTSALFQGVAGYFPPGKEKPTKGI